MKNSFLIHTSLYKDFSKSINTQKLRTNSSNVKKISILKSGDQSIKNNKSYRFNKENKPKKPKTSEEYYINIIKEKDKEILKLKNEIEKYKNFNETRSCLSKSSKLQDDSNNINNILSNSEQIINNNNQTDLKFRLDKLKARTKRLLENFEKSKI